MATELMPLGKAKLVDKVKVRIILNCKASGVSTVGTKAERCHVPGVLDVIFDLAVPLDEGEGVLEWHAIGSAVATTAAGVVVDFTDAHWQVPVLPKERK